MAKVQRGRVSANVTDDVVLFMIGMRINQLWRVTKWFPVFVAMPKMVMELRKNPSLGLLSPPKTYVSGRVIMLVQYWKSFELLEQYARSNDQAHLPAWRKFNRAVRDNGSVGIFHETYRVRAGSVETIYGNMPLFGLAGATLAAPPSKIGQSAATRLGVRHDDESPVEPY